LEWRPEERLLFLILCNTKNIDDAESKRWSERRRREDGIVTDRVDGRLGDLDQEINSETIDKKTPRVDFDTESVTKRVELTKGNLEEL
jgi:hypothetical protein